MAIPTDNLTDKGFNATTRADSSGEDISFDKDPRDLNALHDAPDDSLFELDDYEIDHLAMK